MTEELKPLSEVKAFLEAVPDGEPRCWFMIRKPGMEKPEEISYLDLMNRPVVIPEDRAIKQEASRQRRALIEEWRANATKPAPTFEVLGVIPDRSPCDVCFNEALDVTVHYRLDGNERRDTPQSLSKMLLDSPDRFPKDARAMIAKAVHSTVVSIRDQPKSEENVPLAIKEPTPPVLESVSPGPAKDCDPLQTPALHLSIAEADGINRFLKMANEQGEEAAITAKREEEAPRLEAHEGKIRKDEEVDLQALLDGSWWDIVDSAIDEFLAGEPQLRKVIVCSALSAGLCGKRLHLMAIGDSQIGKSYTFRSIGSRLFPDRLIDAAAMSPKSLYYAADAAGDPKLFDGKIILADELADKSTGTQDFVKALMSNGVEKLTNLTVDEHRKSRTQSIEGIPVMWLTSAEVLEDPEGQLMNRPLIVNPDESAEQTRRVLNFQREAVSTGLLKTSDSKIPRAKRLLARILEEKDFVVYNLFSRHVQISEDDAKARNTLPMFFILVDAIAYAHRFARQVIKLPDERILLMASWEDNVEAAELWQWASGPKSTGLPNRHIELLKILPVFAGDITGGVDLNDIVEMYAAKTSRKVSHKTLANYLSELSTKNKATYYEDAQGRHLWCSTGSAHISPSKSQLLIGMDCDEGNRLLDDALKSFGEAISQLPIEIQIEELRKKVLETSRRG